MQSLTLNAEYNLGLALLSPVTIECAPPISNFNLTAVTLRPRLAAIIPSRSVRVPRKAHNPLRREPERKIQ
jgi:hypothetical protein